MSGADAASLYVMSTVSGWPPASAAVAVHGCTTPVYTSVPVGHVRLTVAIAWVAVIVCETIGAGFQVGSLVAGCDAVTVQAPAARIVTVAVLTPSTTVVAPRLHAVGVEVVNSTGSPEEADALRSSVSVTDALSGRSTNVIVWSPFPMIRSSFGLYGRELWLPS